MKALIPRIWPLGIRLQLMLWYTTVFASLLLFSGALFYLHVEHSLEANLDTTLQVRAQVIAEGITLVGGTIMVRDVTGDLPGFDVSPSEQYVKPVDADDIEMVCLLDARGHIVRETPSFHTLRVPVNSFTMPRKGIVWQGTVTKRDGQEVRLVSLALAKNGKRFAVIQVGEPLAELHTLLHDLVGELLIVGMIVLLACAVGGYWLTAQAFTPIQRLAATARRIKAGDLHQRVAVPLARDEVQYLALTLNEMLDSLEQAFSSQRRFVLNADHEHPICLLLCLPLLSHNLGSSPPQATPRRERAKAIGTLALDPALESMLYLLYTCSGKREKQGGSHGESDHDDQTELEQSGAVCRLLCGQSRAVQACGGLLLCCYPGT